MSKMILSNGRNPYILRPVLTDFIKSYEGLHDGDKKTPLLEPQLCPAKFWTYGYGKRCIIDGISLHSGNCKKDDPRLKLFDLSNEHEAVLCLERDIMIFAKGVASRLNVDIEVHQFEVLISHAYNCGYSQTLYALVNSGQSKGFIANWIRTHYTKSGLKLLKGLVARRSREADIFINGWSCVVE